jgi:hypothetical protein
MTEVMGRCGGPASPCEASRYWHDVGSIVTSALLLPVALSHGPERVRFKPGWAASAMVLTALVATGWILARSDGRYPLGGPIFPALAVSGLLWLGHGAGLVRDRELAPPTALLLIRRLSREPLQVLLVDLRVGVPALEADPVRGAIACEGEVELPVLPNPSPRLS